MIETVDEIKEKIKQLEVEIRDSVSLDLNDFEYSELADKKGQLKAYQDVLPFVEKLQKTIHHDAAILASH